MREKLKNIEGVRNRFIATFIRYGQKAAYKGYPIVTLLFENVRDKYGEVFTEHIWFTTNKSFEKFNFNEGDNIVFDARVKTYIKGYIGRNNDWDDSYDIKTVTKDYKLSHPNNIVWHGAKENVQLSLL